MLSDRFQLSPRPASSDSSPDSLCVLRGRARGEARWLLGLPAALGDEPDWSLRALRLSELNPELEIVEVGLGSPEDRDLGLEPDQPYVLLEPHPALQPLGAPEPSWEAEAQAALLDQALAHLAAAAEAGLELGPLQAGAVFAHTQGASTRYVFASLGPAASGASDLQSWGRALRPWIDAPAWVEFLAKLPPEASPEEVRRALWRQREGPTPPEWEAALEDLSRRALSPGAPRWAVLRAMPQARAELCRRLGTRLASAGLALSSPDVSPGPLVGALLTPSFAELSVEARAERLSTLRRVVVSERGFVLLGLDPGEELPRRGLAALESLSPPLALHLETEGPDEARAERSAPPRARDARRLWRLLALAPAGLEPELAIRLGGLGRAATEAAHEALRAGGWVQEGAPWRLTRPPARARLDSKDEVSARSIAGALRAEGEPSAWSDSTCENLSHLAAALSDGELAQLAIAEAIRRDRSAGRLWSALDRLEAWARLAAERPPEERVPLWRELGEVRAALGDLAGAAEATATALATRSLAPEARAELHLARAQYLLGLGEVRAAGEALARAQKALTRETAPGLEWRAKSLAVQVALKGGERQEARRLAQDALEAEPDARARASFLNLRGLAELHLGLLAEAKASFADALARCRELNLAAGVSACLSNLALQADHAGDLARAQALHQEALDAARAADLTGAAGTAHANLGNLANRRGHLPAAEEHYQASLRTALERGDEEALCLALCALSDVARGRGEARRAADLTERAAAFARDLPRTRALVASNRAEAALTLERLPEAREAASRCLALREQLSEPAREARAAALLTQIQVRAGAWAEARAALARADALLPPAEATSRGVDHPQARAWIELARSELARVEGRATQATTAATAARSLALSAGALALQGRASLAAAEALTGSEADAARAQELAREAASLAAAAGAEDLRHAAELLQVRLGLPRDPGLAPEALERARAAEDFAFARGLVRLRLRAARLQWAARRRAGDEAAAAAAARAFHTIAREVLALSKPQDRERSGEHPDLRLGAPLPAAPSPAASPRASAPAPPTRSEDLERSLAAAQVLLAADQVWVLRGGGAKLEVLAGGDAPPPASELIEAALRAQAPAQGEGWLAVPLQRRGAVLLAARSADFDPAEVQAACGVGLAIARHLDAPQPGPSTRSSPGARYGLFGSSPRLREVLERLERFAPYPLPVWIQGESGTGKELVARALHAASGRRGPWVAVNLGALAEDLRSAELFGAERGAYTGAHETRRGVFELAHGGTLFLDEVADASPAVQAALLRVLETGTLRRVGGSTQLEVDVRVLCASHRDLAQAVSSGRFREDLFYRLTALELRLPALRERPEDIALLARHFVREAQRSGRGVGASLSPAALRALDAHPWPGNVRELRNVVERALAVAQGPLLEAADLGLEDDAPRTEGSLATLEREAIEAALAEHATLTAAAKALGINRRTLGRRMERHGIRRPR